MLLPDLALTPASTPLYGALPVKGNRQVVRFSLMLRGLGRG